MDSIPPAFPISLRSWPSNAKDNDLSTIIQRINFERGSFLNITEENLRQEIAEAEVIKEVIGEDESSEEEEEEEPDRLKELMTGRDEMLRELDQAHNAAMLGLEVISAALSKDNPSTASQTMSQQLKDMIGLGTIGLDKLSGPRMTPAMKQANKQTAKGWKMQSLNKSVDSILASAERLKTEVERETIYWGQILAVSDQGWAICRLPNDRHTLGVRFGFSEASPQFKSRSLGALRRNEDGTIFLDQGFITAVPKVLRVRIQVGDTETGSSIIPKAAAENGPVESLILEARNTIFAEELWQELNRESRALGSWGIKSNDDTLICPLSESKRIIFDLVPLGKSASRPSGPDDRTAEGISISFRLLLNYAHRQSHHRRTKPPPMITGEKRTLQPYNLFRPFLTRLQHQETVTQLQNLLKPLCRALGLAALKPTPSYSLKYTIWPLPDQVSIPEQVLMTLTDRLDAVATFTISEVMSITINIRTLANRMVSICFLSASPALAETCPCPVAHNGLSFDIVKDYIYYATSCALASISSGIGTQESRNEEKWRLTAHSNILSKTLRPSNRTKQLSISVCGCHPTIFTSSNVKHGVRIRVVWEWMKGDFYAGDEEAGFNAFMQDQVEKKPVVPRMMDSGRRDVNGPVKNRRGEGVYDWIAWDVEESEDWDDGEGEVVRSLVEVLREAGKAG